MVDVAFEKVFDLLLPPPPLAGRGRAFGVEAEQDGVATGEERMDRLVVAAEGDVLSLVILDDQFKSRGSVIEFQSKFGFAERGGGRLTGFDASDGRGEIFRAGGVTGGEPQARHAARGRFAIEHRQERRLAHVAMPEQRDPLRAGEAFFEVVQHGRAGGRHDRHQNRELR